MLSLPKDLSLFPSICAKWLTTARNFSCRRPNNLFCPRPRHPAPPERGGRDYLGVSRAGSFENEVAPVKRPQELSFPPLPGVADKVRRSQVPPLAGPLGQSPSTTSSDSRNQRYLGIKGIKCRVRALSAVCRNFETSLNFPSRVTLGKLCGLSALGRSSTERGTPLSPASGLEN